MNAISRSSQAIGIEALCRPPESCQAWSLAGPVSRAIAVISRRQLSQYPPGAISPPARHLAQIEFGHEILGGARRHFEFPCDQSRG